MNDNAEAIRARYEVANKTEKGRLLDEFTTMTDHQPQVGDTGVVGEQSGVGGRCGPSEEV